MLSLVQRLKLGEWVQAAADCWRCLQPGQLWQLPCRSARARCKGTFTAVSLGVSKQHGASIMSNLPAGLLLHS